MSCLNNENSDQPENPQSDKSPGCLLLQSIIFTDYVCKANSVIRCAGCWSEPSLLQDTFSCEIAHIYSEDSSHQSLGTNLVELSLLITLKAVCSLQILIKYCRMHSVVNHECKEQNLGLLICDL